MRKKKKGKKKKIKKKKQTGKNWTSTVKEVLKVKELGIISMLEPEK